MLQHKGTTRLFTDRVVLRKFEIDDAEDMFKNWANDMEVTKFLQWKPHGNIEVTRSILELWIRDYKDESTYNWVIELKETGQVIGGISVVNLDERNSFCEIGYCLSKNYWGRGLTSESLISVINFLFSEVGINRIEAKHDTKNIASGKVMKKSGMKYEGTLRQARLRKDDEFYDISIYSILKSEYRH